MNKRDWHGKERNHMIKGKFSRVCRNIHESMVYFKAKFIRNYSEK